MSKFSRDVILSENISGRASLKMRLNADFSLGKGIHYPSIDSDIDLEIQNGELKNAVIMKDIAESVKDSPAKLMMGKKNMNMLEKRLQNISFSTLKNHITIKNENGEKAAEWVATWYGGNDRSKRRQNTRKEKSKKTKDTRAKKSRFS